uniref:preprotein translocase subunit G n=1 Tax=Synarthrophyton patena TaxID=48972 RepID=UPI002182576D|nr:preprotein translocase subunit G [Synarthrophyton patena]UVF62928.1 preprotein translocase subunit G [Synarthrophyton patena]
MKLTWYIASILAVSLILINNPKAEGFGGIGNQSQLFSYTRSTQKNLLILTILATSAFMFLTIILTSHFNL